MTESENKLLEIIATMVFKHEAQAKVLHQTIDELMMAQTGKSFDACESALVKCERIEHQKVLELIESASFDWGTKGQTFESFEVPL